MNTDTKAPSPIRPAAGSVLNGVIAAMSRKPAAPVPTLVEDIDPPDQDRPGLRPELAMGSLKTSPFTEEHEDDEPVVDLPMDMAAMQAAIRAKEHANRWLVVDVQKQLQSLTADHQKALAELDRVHQQQVKLILQQLDKLDI